MGFSAGGGGDGDGADDGGDTTVTPMDKVRLIFERFDLDGDGVLDRSELSELVSAVNPSVPDAPDQLSSIVDKLLLSYADHITDLSLSLSLPGLRRFYADDAAADLDLDFSTLNPSKPIRKPSHSTDSNTTIGSDSPPSSKRGFIYDSTFKALEELNLAIRRLTKASRSKTTSKDLVFYDTSSSEWGLSGEMSFKLDKKFSLFCKPRSSKVGDFLEQLEDIRAKIDGSRTVDEAFDGHMEIARKLYDRRMFSQALESFRRASKLKPADARLNFTMGNAHWCLGLSQKARECYTMALESAELDSALWSSLLPQIHVNLGITMEAEGLLINASEHYREAAILCPKHYRALKLLGSALFGVGEFGAAEKALEAALLLTPDYADARCDLGAVLHAIGEKERAVSEFQQALDLKPDHLDALYNLACSYKDAGRYSRAAEVYGRVLSGRPDHWRAQLNRAVSLLGAGEADEAKKALSEALRFTNHAELYNAFLYLKQLQRKAKDGGADWMVADVSNFKLADENTTSREQLIDALRIREVQKITKLGQCEVTLLKKQMEGYTGQMVPQKSIRKAEVELLLRKLLHFLAPETFQSAIKAINEKIWAALDATGSGNVDLGMFFAIIAPICAGKPENRKRAAFDALSWRSVKDDETQGQISRADALVYFRYLRVVYFSFPGFTDVIESRKEEGNIPISFLEFLNCFDNINSGFGIMRTLIKLEADSNMQQSRQICDACLYRITGLMLKEMTSKFCLCTSCYSEGRVPSKFEKTEYEFKECMIR